MAVMQRCPSFVDDNKTHYVIYVEYINKRPIKNKNVAEIWIADGIELQGKGANFTLINELIELENYFEKSKNPFEIAEIVDNIEYCPKCKSYSRDFC